MFGKQKPSNNDGGNTKSNPWGEPSTADSTGGGFWDEPVQSQDAFSAHENSNRERLGQIAVEPPKVGAAKNLLDLIQPVFLFICEKHRVVGNNRSINYLTLRTSCDQLLADIETRAKFDPVLLQQWEKIKDPLLWYIDYWFGSSGVFRAVKDEWNRNRLGEYPAGDDGTLAGDEAFFDELENELTNDHDDNLANERLVFYYVAIGLGFTGVYFKDVPEHHAALRKYMEQLYLRVRHYIDVNPSARVTPDCYQFTDKRDFVAPIRERPMILIAAFLCLLGTFGVGYFYLYGEKKKDLEQVVENIQQTEKEIGTDN